MNETLATRAEIAKLARLIGREADSLSYLESVPADEIRALRDETTEVLFRANGSTPPLFRAGDTSPPAPAEVREWPVEAELDAMATAYDRRVTFLLIPPFEETPGDIERRFLAYCRNASVSCADLRDSFGAFRASGSAPFGFFNSRFGEGHMNARGHEAAAELLARELGNLRRHGLF